MMQHSEDKDEDGKRDGLVDDLDVNPVFGMFAGSMAGMGSSNPENQLLSVFPGTQVPDILDAFGDPDGGFPEEAGETGRSGDVDADRAAAYRRRGETMDVTHDGPFPVVPDADAVAPNSPADPASAPDTFHGTDLLNGAGARDVEGDDTERKRR